MKVRSENLFSGFKLVTIVLLCFLLSSCSPGVYIKPVADFKEATLKTRDIYFKQLKNTHKSSVDKYGTDRQLAVWMKKRDGSVKEWTKKTADRIAKKKAEPVLEKEILKMNC